MQKSRYSSYNRLRVDEVDGIDYLIQKKNRSTGIAIMAPHGGMIEPGTSEIAKALAGEELTYYCFNGIKSSDNQSLHIASENFDEPQGLEIARNAQTVITIHGCSGNNDNIYIGGLDIDLKEKLCFSISEAGFNAITDVPDRMAGRNINNLCNRGNSGKGIQIEISWSLRKEASGLVFHEGNNRTDSSIDKLINVIGKTIRTWSL